ncbi:MAG TPA: hypothetical protein DCZ59_06460, partial [Bacteroidetes bacterium]|nr:hypothetical protein [Bacteroidota bacterium]
MIMTCSTPRPAFLLVCLLLSVVSPIRSWTQEIRLSDWTTISSLYTVNAIDVDSSGRVWAATTGGVVTYDEGSG